MDRRHFFRAAVVSAPAWYRPAGRKTRHVILVVNCAARKKEYYEQPALCPNIHRLANDGFVFEQDHTERISSHWAAFAELLEGREIPDEGRPYHPTICERIGGGILLGSARDIPPTMIRYKPPLLVWREMAHDIGHDDYDRYLRAVRNTDRAIGAIFDWVRSDPYFSTNTSIVVRPEFGRDDEVNSRGQLHHSYGFYYTHRVASIFWGPDFNRGIDRKTLIRAVDLAPTVARLFDLDIHTTGRVVPGLFRS